MGDRVARDVAHSKKILNQQHAQNWIAEFKTEHKKDISDLVNRDSEVSASWLQSMIDKSKEVGDLQGIQKYLEDSSRTFNLTRSEKSTLFAKVQAKMESVREHELMAKFMTFLKDHGDDLF